MTDQDDYAPDQLARVDALSDGEIAAIDAAILEAASRDWRKLAYVVGTAMAAIYVPDVYVAARAAALVSKGKLESRGDLRRMHYSEVRLLPTA